MKQVASCFIQLIAIVSVLIAFAVSTAALSQLAGTDSESAAGQGVAAQESLEVAAASEAAR
ncbi:MAG: hypothetical protein ACRD9R_12970 [Pyrinomonadaceae bacterium]